jgi:hypothetical protein
MFHLNLFSVSISNFLFSLEHESGSCFFHTFLPVFVGLALGIGLIICGDTFVLTTLVDVSYSKVKSVMSLDNKELEGTVSDSVA